MTGRDAIQALWEKYPDATFTTDEIFVWLDEHAPNRSPEGYPTLLLNVTTNVKRRDRPEWKSTYGAKGYNLQFKVGENLYRRYIERGDPPPIMP